MPARLVLAAEICVETVEVTQLDKSHPIEHVFYGQRNVLLHAPVRSKFGVGYGVLGHGLAIVISCQTLMLPDVRCLLRLPCHALPISFFRAPMIYEAL